MRKTTRWRSSLENFQFFQIDHAQLFLPLVVLFGFFQPAVLYMHNILLYKVQSSCRHWTVLVEIKARFETPMDLNFLFQWKSCSSKHWNLILSCVRLTVRLVKLKILIKPHDWTLYEQWIICVKKSTHSWNLMWEREACEKWKCLKLQFHTKER